MYFRLCVYTEKSPRVTPLWLPLYLWPNLNPLLILSAVDIVLSVRSLCSLPPTVCSPLYFLPPILCGSLVCSPLSSLIFLHFFLNLF